MSWMIKNIESSLINQFLAFPTEKALLWKEIKAMYDSRRDGLQMIDLTIKTNDIN